MGLPDNVSPRGVKLSSQGLLWLVSEKTGRRDGGEGGDWKLRMSGLLGQMVAATLSLFISLLCYCQNGHCFLMSLIIVQTLSLPFSFSLSPSLCPAAKAH